MPPKRSVTSRTESSTERGSYGSRSISAAASRLGCSRATLGDRRSETRVLRQPRRADQRGADAPASSRAPPATNAAVTSRGRSRGRPASRAPRRPPRASRRLGVVRLRAGVLGDRRERLAVGRHGDHLLLARAGRRGSCRRRCRARSCRRGCPRLRALGALPGAQETPRLGPVGEEQDRGERPPVLVLQHRRRSLARLRRLAGLPRRRRASSTARASASPIAVPKPGPSRSIPARASSGRASARRPPAARRRTRRRPTRRLVGHPVEEGAHRLLRGGEPRRLHVVGPHRAGDVDDEDDGRALVGRRRRHRRPGERDAERRERGQEQRGRQVAQPGASPSGDRGEHLEVRVPHRVARRAPQQEPVAERRERDEHEAEQEERRLEAHRVTRVQSAWSWS